MTGDVVISQRSSGAWEVKIDGQDFADSIAGCHLTIEGAGKPAHLSLELLDLRTFNGRAVVQVNPAHAVLLRALGWTPPKDKP